MSERQPFRRSADRIIEGISNRGMRTSGYDRTRASTPHPGDHVRWADGSLGRISEIGEPFCATGEAQVSRSHGSAFMTDHGSLMTSGGGPIEVVKLADLHGTDELELSHFWNWGDKGPPSIGCPGNSCEFWVLRPVFEYRKDQ